MAFIKKLFFHFYRSWKSILFWLSQLCTVLVCIFLWTKISLNGYGADIYFFITTTILHLISFWILRKPGGKMVKALINISIAALQLIGLGVFLWADTMQVDKVYQRKDAKDNLYSAFSGWYLKSYYKPNIAELCGEGVLWETKVPYYFPIIEIETRRIQCHEVGTDSSYQEFYHHEPE